jgi:hypothetical protein
MNPKDGWRNIAKDAGLDSQDLGLEQVYDSLVQTPGVMAHIEPPAGYEDKLLKSLMVQLPQVAPVPNLAASTAPKAAWRLSISKWTFAGWSMAGTFAIALIVLGTFNQGQLNRSPGEPEDNLIAATVERGGEKLVSRWIASMGDSAQIIASQGNLESLGRGQDPKVMDRALNEVAKSMGMKF